MNKKSILTALGALGIGLVAGAFLFDGGGHDHAAASAGNTGAAAVWTCSMHPQIRQPDPGKCPICAMDLIPAGGEGSAAVGPRQLAMSEESRALARITTTPVVREMPEVETRLFGKVAMDETRIRTIAAYFPARIDELFVDYTGITVGAGDHLAEVYSPELLTAQRELLTARSYDPGAPAAQAAREKLELWGFPAARIAQIIASGEVSDHLTIDAPIGGVVTHKNISEGDYVQTGMPMFRIADLSEVWVMFDAYESDLPWLRYGQALTFEADGVPGETFQGTIAFIAPEVNPMSRTVDVRVNANNAEGILKPGMFVRAKVRAQVAGKGRVISSELAGKWISPMHPEIVRDEPGPCPVCGMALVKAEDLGYTTPGVAEPPLLVPASAVLQTGERAVVYLAVPGADSPTYEGREIVLGPRAGDRYIVASGLSEGDRVVTSGAFKIDSALQIQAKPSMMSTEGGSGSPYAEIELTREEAQQVYGHYFAVQEALAADDLDAAKSAAENLLDFAGLTAAADLQNVIAAIASAAEFNVARVHFEILSNAVESLAARDATRPSEPIYLAHCPMAFDWEGADWLQRDETINNPYFGAEMLRCGAITRPLGGGKETQAAGDADEPSPAPES